MNPCENSRATVTASDDNIPVSEWIVAALGAGLLLATFGFLVMRAIAETEPPRFTAEIEKIRKAGDNYAVSIRAHNQGGQPVSKLVVRARRGSLDEREVTIDYLPSHSARRVTFLFDEPAVADHIEVTFAAYSEP